MGPTTGGVRLEADSGRCALCGATGVDVFDWRDMEETEPRVEEEPFWCCLAECGGCAENCCRGFC